jgi:glycosyltransferase involved in cell wall biosynthesis
MNSIPIISVVMITYAHEKYIQEAIEGVFLQQFNGTIELIIANDHSPDATDEIVKRVIKNAPQHIKVNYTYHEINKGMMPNFVWALQQTNGKYIAICEGDDYWTDPLKLQKQVSFLEENLDCSICFHAAKHENVINADISYISQPKRKPIENKFHLKDLILGGGGFMTSNSMVFLRKYILNMPTWVYEAPVGDGPLALILASKGRIGYLEDVMSVYRLFSNSNSWSVSMKNRDKERIHHHKIIKMWKDFDNWSEFRHNKTIMKKINLNKLNYFKKRFQRIIKMMLNK